MVKNLGTVDTGIISGRVWYRIEKYAVDNGKRIIYDLTIGGDSGCYGFYTLAEAKEYVNQLRNSRLS